MQKKEWSEPQWGIIEMKDTLDSPITGIISFNSFNVEILQVTIPTPSTKRDQQSDRTTLYPLSSIHCIHLISEDEATTRNCEEENQRSHQIEDEELFQELTTRLIEVEENDDLPF